MATGNSWGAGGSVIEKHPDKNAKSELGVQERTCCKPEQTPCCEHAGEACSIQLLSWKSGEIMPSSQMQVLLIKLGTIH